MKPRLVRIYGLWHCGGKGKKRPLGIGFTKEAAWDDWFRMVRKEWLK
jgi:hypothetical protein